MEWWKKFIKRFSPYNLVIMALVSAIGIAVKPIASSLAHIITGPLYIRWCSRRRILHDVDCYWSRACSHTWDSYFDWNYPGIDSHNNWRLRNT